jgi:hypothetical protein
VRTTSKISCFRLLIRVVDSRSRSISIKWHCYQGKSFDFCSKIISIYNNYPPTRVDAYFRECNLTRRRMNLRFAASNPGQPDSAVQCAFGLAEGFRTSL